MDSNFWDWVESLQRSLAWEDRGMATREGQKLPKRVDEHAEEGTPVYKTVQAPDEQTAREIAKEKAQGRWPGAEVAQIEKTHKDYWNVQLRAPKTASYALHQACGGRGCFECKHSGLVDGGCARCEEDQAQHKDAPRMTHSRGGGWNCADCNNQVILFDDEDEDGNVLHDEHYCDATGKNGHPFIPKTGHLGDDNGAHHILPGWGKHPDQYVEPPQGDDLEEAHGQGNRPKAILGSTSEGHKVYFDPDLPEAHLANAHVTITGESGSGKTQAMKSLLADLSEWGVPSLVLDFKDDYAEVKYAKAQGFSVYDPTRRPLPFNPLQPSIDPQTGEGNKTFHTYQLVEILARIYHLGELQQFALREAIKAAYADAGDALPTFEAVKTKLEGTKGNGELLGHLAPIFDFGFFSDPDPQGFARIVGGNTVIRLAQLPGNEVKNSVAEFFLMALYNHLVRLEQTHLLRQVLVLDEAWRVVNSPFLEPLMREARAFGLGVFVATQFPTDLPLAVSGSAATALYFSQSNPDQVDEIERDILGGTNGAEAMRLGTTVRSMLPLQCLVHNRQYAPYVQIDARPYYARSFEATATVFVDDSSMGELPRNSGTSNFNMTKGTSRVAHETALEHYHDDTDVDGTWTKPQTDGYDPHYTPQGPIKIEDIDEFKKDPRWQGFGYLGAARGHPEMHAALAEAANKVGVSHEDLFHWTNSKYGTWAAEGTMPTRKCPNCEFKSCPKCSHGFFNASADPERRWGDEDRPCENCGVDMKAYAKQNDLPGDPFRTQAYHLHWTSPTCEDCGTSNLGPPMMDIPLGQYSTCKVCDATGERDGRMCNTCKGSGLESATRMVQVPYERRHLVKHLVMKLPLQVRELNRGREIDRARRQSKTAQEKVPADDGEFICIRCQAGTENADHVCDACKSVRKDSHVGVHENEQDHYHPSRPLWPHSDALGETPLGHEEFDHVHLDEIGPVDNAPAKPELPVQKPHADNYTTMDLGVESDSGCKVCDGMGYLEPQHNKCVECERAHHLKQAEMQKFPPGEDEDDGSMMFPYSIQERFVESPRTKNRSS